MGQNMSGLKDKSTKSLRHLLIQSMKKELLNMPCFDRPSSQTLTEMETMIRFIYYCHGVIYKVLYQ